MSAAAGIMLLFCAYLAGYATHAHNWTGLAATGLGVIGALLIIGSDRENT